MALDLQYLNTLQKKLLERKSTYLSGLQGRILNPKKETKPQGLRDIETQLNELKNDGRTLDDATKAIDMSSDIENKDEAKSVAQRLFSKTKEHLEKYSLENVQRKQQETLAKGFGVTDPEEIKKISTLDPAPMLAAPVKAVQQAPKAFKGFKDLTTKFFNFLKGKNTVGRQEVADFANRPELKKGEADLLNRKVAEEFVDKTKLPAQEFADSIRRDLLELKPVKVKDPQFMGTTVDATANRGGLVGKNYEEVVFESPIVTNGSPSHFPNSKKYFAHARGDEVVGGGNKIWREQEIQSDLLQKDNLLNKRKLNLLPEEEKRLAEIQTEQFRIADNFNPKSKELRKEIEAIIENAKKRDTSFDQLQPFTNDRFGERIMRERIREKASKGYSKYRLPTGETIGKIEGFEANQFIHRLPDGRLGSIVDENTIKIGDEISNGGNANDFIVTDILGDGRFKAMLKEHFDSFMESKGVQLSGDDMISYAEQHGTQNFWGSKETFDLTGKSNPQAKRYEKWGKFLKNKYGGKEATDSQGNSWIEIDLTKQHAIDPVEAFGFVDPKVATIVGITTLVGGAGVVALLKLAESKDMKGRIERVRDYTARDIQVASDVQLPQIAIDLHEFEKNLETPEDEQRLKDLYEALEVRYQKSRN